VNSGGLNQQGGRAVVRGRDVLPRRSVLANLRGGVVLAGIAANTIAWCLPLFALALAKAVVPGVRLRRSLARGLMAIGECWVGVNGAILGLNRRGLPDVRGMGDLDRHAWYLLVANHQTWVDIIVLQTAFNRRIPFLKFFIKQELIWFPFLGLAWWALDMPFMKRHPKSWLARHPDRRNLDLEATQAACSKFREVPTSVINFVEGTRSTPEKRARRRSPYENLLPPRAGGLAYVLAAMGEKFAAILDVTVVYPDGAPGFWELCCGRVRRVVVHVRERPVADWLLQGDYLEDRAFRTAFHRWLADVWKEKDARIAALEGESTPAA
jgi:1-acyl-sn-glycerol-3-phosphate acyltransferase